MFQRRGFLVGLRTAGRGGDVGVPGQTQAADVARVDLIERAIALLGPIAVVADPILAGSPGVFERGVVNRVRGLGQGDRSREQRRGEQCE